MSKWNLDRGPGLVRLFCRAGLGRHLKRRRFANRCSLSANEAPVTEI
ncbi:BnaC09g53230D [Brassica napus]|uniref:BnaC09g53230D protein n=1 Tax=Brassica napus TaxID=3708 RepID=A0A078JB16_BRANA|nr:BnaC09g53230D [Brassica napus]